MRRHPLCSGEQNSREEILARVSMTKAAPFVLEKMAKTERFRDVKLWGYVNDISEEEQSQFAVMCAGLPDGSIYVSFRAQTIRSQGGERILIWDTSRRRPVS